MNNKPRLTGLGIALGAVLGTLFGVMAGHVGLWLPIGVAIGLALGVWVRRKAPACPRCTELHRGHVSSKQEV
jgi:F0F1-type ATP synthase assembly protein I